MSRYSNEGEGKPNHSEYMYVLGRGQSKCEGSKERVCAMCLIKGEQRDQRGWGGVEDRKKHMD